MTSKRNWTVLILLFSLGTLFLLGCVRPMPGDEGVLILTPAPAEDSPAYPAPAAESGGEAAVQEAYPAEEGYPVEQEELLQPEAGGESTEAYPAPEDEAAADETAESTTSEAETSEGDAAGEEPAAEETAEGQEAQTDASDPEGAETEDTEAEDSASVGTEGETAEEEAAADEAQEESAASQTETSEPAETGRTHTVAPGETLFRIGLQYGMSWVTIAQANNITNPDSLYVGQVLVIPDVETLEETESTEAAETEAAAGEDEPTAGETEESEEAAAAEETTYIVQSGDTLLSISYRFGVNMMDIARENELLSFDQIYVGQELIIPQAEDETTAADESDSSAGAAQAGETTHIVAEGETVFTIAFQYGIAWTRLVEANEMTSPYTLEAGQTLIIPASE